MRRAAGPRHTSGRRAVLRTRPPGQATHQATGQYYTPGSGPRRTPDQLQRHRAAGPSDQRTDDADTCLISEWVNGSLVIICPGPWPQTKYTAIVRWQPPARETRHPARADSDEPDASRADAQAVGRRSGIGAEYEAGLARTEDGAGGGQAE